jgi:hypothetical protein
MRNARSERNHRGRRHVMGIACRCEMDTANDGLNGDCAGHVVCRHGPLRAYVEKKRPPSFLFERFFFLRSDAPATSAMRSFAS